MIDPSQLMQGNPFSGAPPQSSLMANQQPGANPLPQMQSIPGLIAGLNMNNKIAMPKTPNPQAMMQALGNQSQGQSPGMMDPSATVSGAQSGAMPNTNPFQAFQQAMQKSAQQQSGVGDQTSALAGMFGGGQ